MTPLLVFSVEEAHASKWVQYEPETGVATLHHPALSQSIQIPPEQQFSTILPTYMDLQKSLSRLATSPVLADGRTLRDVFDEEFARYTAMLQSGTHRGQVEPDYGTYVYDTIGRNLYTIAPEEWFTVGLTTSTSMLIRDHSGKMTWRDIRKQLRETVVGVVGASVGGNVLEGIIREVRPKYIKIADPDTMEITNLNRFMRGSLRYLSQPRSSRRRLLDGFSIHRVNKAWITEYELMLTDPYSQWYSYPTGVTAANIESFTLGNAEEPKLHILIEEADNLTVKVQVREHCRKHKIPVLMVSDFGHRVFVQFHDFSRDQSLPLGHGVEDTALYTLLDTAMTTGNRTDVFSFVRALCGDGYDADEFGSYIAGTGEHPTSSLPQSGATALIAGGIAGKIVAWSRLGYTIPARWIFDSKNYSVIV